MLMAMATQERCPLLDLASKQCLTGITPLSGVDSCLRSCARGVSILAKCGFLLDTFSSRSVLLSYLLYRVFTSEDALGIIALTSCAQAATAFISSRIVLHVCPPTAWHTCN